MFFVKPKTIEDKLIILYIATEVIVSLLRTIYFTDYLDWLTCGDTPAEINPDAPRDSPQVKPWCYKKQTKTKHQFFKNACLQNLLIFQK